MDLEGLIDLHRDLTGSTVLLLAQYETLCVLESLEHMTQTALQLGLDLIDDGQLEQVELRVRERQQLLLLLLQDQNQGLDLTNQVLVNNGLLFFDFFNVGSIVTEQTNARDTRLGALVHGSGTWILAVTIGTVQDTLG